MMKIKRFALTPILILAISALPTSLRADGTDAWKKWQALLQKSCPNNHVDWVGGSLIELISAFEDTLGASDQRKISHLRDFRSCQ